MDAQQPTESTASQRIFRIATRSSALAMTQTHEIIDLLVSRSELGLTKDSFQIIPISNAPGDQNLKDPLYTMGGIGVFTKIVEVELLNNNGDIAVHSLKDLPTVIDERLVVAAIPPLKPRSDVVIYRENSAAKSLENLPAGTIIGTSSLRRITNLKHRYPHLKFENIRGNLNTRLQKLDAGQYDAIILAEAGVVRLGWQDKIGQVLSEEDYLYAPGQGALGVQCRADDAQTIQLLKCIHENEPAIRVHAERQFLNKLEGGCKLPIAVHTKIEGNVLKMTGQVWSLEADKTIRDTIEGDITDTEIGQKLSEKMKNAGASAILDVIRKQMAEQGANKTE